MSSLSEWLTRKQDERERSYTARAYQLAFCVTFLACGIIAAVALTQGRLVSALVALLPSLLGSLTASALMLYWKVLR